MPALRRTPLRHLPLARRSAVAVLGAAALLALSACSGTPAPAASSAGSASAAAGPASLKTVTAGKLTVATGQPAYSPWVEDDEPESGQGLRVRRHLRGREAARLRGERRRLGALQLRLRRRPGREAVGPQHPAVLDHRGPQEGRRLLLALLHDHAGRRDVEGLEGRRRHHPRRAEGAEDRRRDRHDQLHGRERGGRPARRLQLGRRRRAGAEDEAGRRGRHRPARRVLHRRRAARRRGRVRPVRLHGGRRRVRVRPAQGVGADEAGQQRRRRHHAPRAS